MSDDGWYTVTAANSSPVEQQRDRMIERAIERDGRPLEKLGIVATFKRGRWDIEILDRLDLLARLDARGRDGGTSANGRELVKHAAAWIRGLPAHVCPEVFVWCHDGGASYERGTIQRRRP